MQMYISWAAKLTTSLGLMYSKEQNKPLICLLINLNEQFLREHGVYKITATLKPS